MLLSSFEGGGLKSAEGGLKSAEVAELLPGSISISLLEADAFEGDWVRPIVTSAVSPGARLPSVHVRGAEPAEELVP